MPKSDQHVDNQRYAVIPRVLVFVFRGNDVLLIKGSSTKKIWAGKYNGIGGHVEKGETVLDAAKRELREESGISECDLRLSVIVMMEVDLKKGICLFVFKGIYAVGQIKACQEGDLEWVNSISTEAIPVVEDLPILLEQVKKQHQDVPVLFARSFYDEQMKLRTVFNS